MRINLTRCAEAASIIGTAVALFQCRAELSACYQRALHDLRALKHLLGSATLAFEKLNTMYGLLSWPDVKTFAVYSEVSGVAFVFSAALALAACLRVQHVSPTALLSDGDRKRLRALFGFMVSTGCYYLAYASFGSDVLPTVLLELINLSLGYFAFELAHAIRPATEPRGSVQRALPSIAIVALGIALVALLFVPDHAAALGIGSRDESILLRNRALVYLTAFGTSPYVACGGYQLWKAHHRAPKPLQYALRLYFWGLASRTFMVLAAPVSWSGITGISYFLTMEMKFACAFAVAIALAERLLATARTKR